MTNYNERLDEILKDIIHIGYVSGYNQVAHEARISPYNHIEPLTIDEAKQALTSLIKELVAEAKPEMPYEKLKSCPVCGEPQYNHSGDVHFDYGVNQYEENLLKALEGK